ncbi:MAG: C39 family peptidase [Deltaproteobacteria bacterium]|nr:C39 family peptidase [Deltaproteobacteria bacterium]
MNRFIILIVVATSLVISPPAGAAVIAVPGASGGDFTVKVTSLKERRFKTTIRQQYDFSCGSAALATLLTFHYEDPVGEPEVFKAMYDAGNQEKIKKDGFSLLDIKKYLKARGYRADGFRTTLDKLKGVGIPAIVLINHDGYRHFVVLKGVTGSEVLLGDPSHGVRRMPRDWFESMWNGLLFLIRNKLDVATRYFNRKRSWQIHARAPLGMALGNHELANVTWMLRGVNDF